MPLVQEHAELDRSAVEAWRTFGDFGAVGDWHPMLDRVQSDGNVPGARRRVTTKEGQQQVERLESYDSEARTYRYMLEESALPVDNYEAEFRIDAVAEHRSIVSWSARFDVDGGDEAATVEAVRQFIRAGVDALASR